jgi:hypothetical protein
VIAILIPAILENKMSWVEDQGHRWPSDDPSYYDHQNQQLVVRGDQTTGQEPCEYCGMPFVKFSLALQQGTIIACSKSAIGAHQRIVDGIIIVGPEA